MKCHEGNFQRIKEQDLKAKPTKPTLKAGFQTFPALKRTLSTEEIAAFAWEEHAQAVARGARVYLRSVGQKKSNI